MSLELIEGKTRRLWVSQMSYKQWVLFQLEFGLLALSIIAMVVFLGNVSTETVRFGRDGMVGDMDNGPLLYGNLTWSAPSNPDICITGARSAIAAAAGSGGLTVCVQIRMATYAAAASTSTRMYTAVGGSTSQAKRFRAAISTGDSPPSLAATFTAIIRNVTRSRKVPACGR